MYVIKRDGRKVSYDREKIVNAIHKANNEVSASERVLDSRIEDIVKGIEAMERPEMMVEEIQDIIEQRLMAEGKFVLAKHILFIGIPVSLYGRQILRTNLL